MTTRIPGWLVAILILAPAFPLQADHTPPAASVAIAGNLQSELGCPGDWQPDCAVTELAYDVGDGIWQASFALPAGNWEYKAALNDSWNESYGANAQQDGPNIPLSLGAGATVKFYYDHVTHWVTDAVNSRIVTAPGSYQSELGCPGDWQPDCLRSWLQDPDGDGIYAFETDQLPAGSYEVRAAINESWDENYGAGGVRDGPNIPFSVADGDTIVFVFDSATNVLSVSIAAPATYAIIHYLRDDGDYGDHTTGNYNDYWGLHLWGDIDETIEWTAPKLFLGEDEYGRFAWVKLSPNASNVGFIVHRGDIKDGTVADRFFDPSTNPEIWLRSDDPTTYTSQAVAQGYVTIHYHRPDGDYGDPTSSDFNDYWGLHVWGDAVDTSELTDWTAPKRPSGFDSFGAWFQVLLQDAGLPVNFILHRGDTKDPGPDQSFIPLDTAAAWVQSGDEQVYAQRGAAERVATLHYRRDAGDYGDYASSDYNDFWGLHVWDGAASPNPSWQEPIKPAGFDIFGPYFRVDLLPAAAELAYILHRGDAKDPGPDQFLSFEDSGYEVWQLEGADPDQPYILPVTAGEPVVPPDINDEIDRLEDEGVLNSGQANSLRVKLAAAEASVAKGNDNAAINQLNAFINHVWSLVAEGVLTQEEGELLVGLAEDLIEDIMM